MPIERRVHRRWLPLVVIIVVATLVRLPGLLEPLWFDELWATSLALGSVPTFLAEMLTDVHPPLYAVLMFGWIRIFGDSELSVRLPALLAGLTTVALMPALGRRLVTERAGWIAAGLLALSPVHIWFSQEARMYALLMLLAVATVIVAGRLASEETSGRWNLWFFLVALALMLSHFFGIIVLAAIALWSFRFPANARRVVLSVSAGCAMLLAAIVFFKLRVGLLRTQLWYLDEFTLDVVPRLLRWLVAGSLPGTPLGGVLAALVVTSVVLAAIGLVRRNQDHVPRSVLASLVLGTPVLMWLIGVAGFERYYVERSTLAILPFLLLAVAAGTESLGSARKLPSRLAVLVLSVGGIVSVSTYLKGREGPTVAHPNADWRSAEPILQSYRELTPGRAAVVVGTTPLDELRYYRRGSQRCFVRDTLATMAPFRCDHSQTATLTGDHLYLLTSDRVAELRRVLSAESSERAMLIVRSSWRANADSLLDNLKRDPELNVNSAGTVRGLEFWSIDQRPPD